MTDETIQMMAKYPNICKHIHLPLQSWWGSNTVLKLCVEVYTREWFLDRVAKIRELIPDCGISTDIFCGFHAEGEAEFEETVKSLCGRFGSTPLSSLSIRSVPGHTLQSILKIMCLKR